MGLQGFPATTLASLETYIAKARRGGTYPGSLQGIPNSAETNIVFDSHEFTRQGSKAWQAPGTNYTPPVTGIWHARAYCLFYSLSTAADTAGGRQVAIRRQSNSALLVKDSKPAFGPLGVATATVCDVTLDMTAGTFAIYLTAFHNAGAGINILIEPYLVLEYKGP